MTAKSAEVVLDEVVASLEAWLAFADEIAAIARRSATTWQGKELADALDRQAARLTRIRA